MAAAAAALIVVASALMNRTSLPPLDGRQASTPLADTANTWLGQAIHGAGAGQPATNGIFALPAALDAFAARMLLIRAADRWLAIPYCIWHADTTGTLMLDEVRLMSGLPIEGLL